MTVARTLIHDKTLGAPFVRLINHSVPSTQNQDGRVLVKWLAAPINRVDLMVLAGQYPVKPRHSLNEQEIPGFDGCGVVLASTSPLFKDGDLVIPRELGLGTWRTHAVLEDQLLIKLPQGTPPVAGSLLRSGALVAWLLLEEVRELKDGDWIIVSAGNSCVAQFLAQYARRKNINTILVVRDRNNIDETREHLLELGAAAVITESDLRKADSALFSNPIVFAVDCVFGAVGQDLANVLSPGGTFVLAGMLSGIQANITISPSHLFFKQLTFRSFRGSEILKNMGAARTERLIGDIASLFVTGSIKVPQVRQLSWAEISDEALEGGVEDARSNETGLHKIVFLPCS